MQEPPYQQSNIIKCSEALPCLEKQTRLADLISSILNQKIAADVAYAHSLSEIINKENRQKIKDTRCKCAKIFNFLIDTIQHELTVIQKSIQQKKRQVMNVLDKFMQKQIFPMTSKADTIRVKKFQIEVNIEQMEEHLKKYMVQYDEANKLFEEFIVSAIQFRGFEKKNNLCHKAESFFSEKVAPMKIQYETKAAQLKELIEQYQDVNLSSRLETAKKQNNFIETYKYLVQTQSKINSDRYESIGKNLSESLNKFSKKIEKLDEAPEEEIEETFHIPKGPDYFYLYSLFLYSSRPLEKKLEAIMDFGQKQYSRDSLNSSIISSSTMGDLLPEQIGEYTYEQLKAISDTFKDIFFQDGNQIEQIKGLLHSIQNQPKLRKLVMLCFERLRQQQSECEIEEAHLDNIVFFISGLLTQCMEESDIYNSKLLLLHLSSFYVKKEKEEINLNKYLKDHPIWASLEWWSCAFLQNCYQSLIAKPKYSQHQEDMINIWLIKGICGAKESVGSDPNIRIFNLLDSFTFRMKDMEISNNMIQKMTNKFVEKLELWKLVVSNESKSISSFLTVNRPANSKQNFNFWKRLFR